MVIIRMGLIFFIIWISPRSPTSLLQLVNLIIQLYLYYISHLTVLFHTQGFIRKRHSEFEAVRHAATQFYTTLDDSPLPTILFDRENYQVIFFNSQAEDFFDHAFDERNDVKFTELFESEGSTEFKEALSELNEFGQGVRQQISMTLSRSCMPDVPNQLSPPKFTVIMFNTTWKENSVFGASLINERIFSALKKSNSTCCDTIESLSVIEKNLNQVANNISSNILANQKLISGNSHLISSNKKMIDDVCYLHKTSNMIQNMIAMDSNILESLNNFSIKSLIIIAADMVCLDIFKQNSLIEISFSSDFPEMIRGNFIYLRVLFYDLLRIFEKTSPNARLIIRCESETTEDNNYILNMKYKILMNSQKDSSPALDLFESKERDEGNLLEDYQAFIKTSLEKIISKYMISIRATKGNEKIDSKQCKYFLFNQLHTLRIQPPRVPTWKRRLDGPQKQVPQFGQR